MQHTPAWMQYWSRRSITNCCPKITTRPFQVKEQRNTMQILVSTSTNWHHLQDNSKTTLCFRLIRKFTLIRLISLANSTSTRITYPNGWNWHRKNMMEESDNKIRELMERNHNKQTAHTDHTLGHECTELKQGGDLMVNFINVQDRFTPVRNKTVNLQPLETAVDRNKFRGSNFCLKVMGYVTWIAHHWRDKVYLKKNTTCNHQYLCPCKKKLLADRQIDRPFVELPIRDPQMLYHQPHDCRNHSFVKPSAKDEENLIRVGLLVSTLISADNTTSPAIPNHMDKYKISEFRLNNRVCRACTGRVIRYQAALEPARHAVTWIKAPSPLMEIISK